MEILNLRSLTSSLLRKARLPKIGQTDKALQTCLLLDESSSATNNIVVFEVCLPTRFEASFQTRFEAGCANRAGLRHGFKPGLKTDFKPGSKAGFKPDNIIGC